MKGSDVYTVAGVGNDMVALSALLVRRVDVIKLTDILTEIFKKPLNKRDIEDIMVLAFQTRDIRGGKGERDAFRMIYAFLLSNSKTKALALDLLDLVPEYGCWQDIFKIRASYPYTAARINKIVKAQFCKDEDALIKYTATISLTGRAEQWGGKVEVAKPKLSLLAKWMPREGQRDATEMAILLVPGPMLLQTRMKHYRKRVSALNKALDTVEVKMCSKTWALIEPACVPGRAGKNYVKAFLNEAGTTKKGQSAPRGKLRHPGDSDRMACRENFQEYFQKTASGQLKAKGADTLFPHEVVKKAMALLDNNWISGAQAMAQQNSEMDHLRGVWRSMVEAAKEGGGLGRSLAMCDFSGSMTSSACNGDTPFWVSMALGLLISEVTTKEFKNTFLTFDSSPQMHTLPEGDLFDKLISFDSKSLSQGISTDFQKAMDLVLAQCKKERVRPGEEPENLIVLTDMAWDQAYSSSQYSQETTNHYRNVVKTNPWQTHIEMIREAFKRAGEDMWGHGLKMPTIVIWNIAASCRDFHAKADTEGVVMLSGWSPSLFKVLQTKGVVRMTPAEALRIQLEDERYDMVRERIRKFTENHIPAVVRENVWNTFMESSPQW